MLCMHALHLTWIHISVTIWALGNGCHQQSNFGIHVFHIAICHSPYNSPDGVAQIFFLQLHDFQIYKSMF
jgi:hypothetical protein